MTFLRIDIFRLFGWGFVLAGVFLVCFFFLGLVEDSFPVIYPA